MALAEAAETTKALAAKQTAVELPEPPKLPNPADALPSGPAASSSGAESAKALAAKQTAVELPEPPKLPNPADAAKKIAGKAPISAVSAQSLPAKVPPYPAKAAKAGKETSAKSQSPDPKEGLCVSHAPHSPQ